MKKTLLTILLVLTLHSIAGAQAKQTTPNLGLTLPPAAPNTWGSDYNNNFTILDTAVGLVYVPRVTVATKPPSPATNQLIVVTDALSGTTCDTGGGVANTICQWTGSVWVALGSGGGGAGHVIYEETGSLTARSKLRFLGAGATAVDNAGNDSTDVTIPGGSFTISGVGVMRQTSPGVFDTVDPTASPCSVGSAPRGLNANLTPFGCTAYHLLDPDLTIYAGITPSADTQTLLGSANFAAWRTNLSLVPGTNVQAFDAQLADLAALAPTANRLLMSDATNFVYGILPSTACDPLRWDPATRTFTCASYPTGGVSGTLNKLAKFNSTTTVGDSGFASESGTGVTITGQTCLDGGTGCTNGWRPITTGFTSLISRTMKEVAGTEAVTTGTISNGNCLQGDASGRIITTGIPCASTPSIPVSKSVTLLDPTAADTNKIQFYFAATTTLVRIACSTDTGTATINFDERAEATPNTAGTNTLASNLVCDNNSQTTTTFSDTTIAANVPYNLQVISVSGSPTVVRVHVTGTN